MAYYNAQVIGVSMHKESQPFIVKFYVTAYNYLYMVTKFYEIFNNMDTYLI